MRGQRLKWPWLNDLIVQSESILKYMTAYNTNRYIDVLQDLVTNYNNTTHGTTGFKPNDVGDEELKVIFEQKRDRIVVANRSNRPLLIGQKVRRWKEKGLLEKKTSENFYRGTYTIVEVLPFSYKVENEKGEILKQTLKRYELQPIDEVEEFENKKNIKAPNIREVKKNQYTIDQVLKREGVDQSNVQALPRRRIVRSTR
eukprot:Lithocolla_globosa_v1_NODE_20_length_9637_cov_33.687643.p5 type:complete len:200 gc:universal NODE_20_length_9637_cov_33.687643:1453-2052(+)